MIDPDKNIGPTLQPSFSYFNFLNICEILLVNRLKNNEKGIH